MLLKGLNNLGVPAIRNERDDLILAGKKISGSAFKNKKDKGLHHGTLLINANLSHLKGALCPSLELKDVKGVSSVKSPVTNIELVAISEVIKSISLEFSDSNPIYFNHATLINRPRIADLAIALKEKDWVFGKTPKFVFERQRTFSWGNIVFSLGVNKGKVCATKVSGNGPTLDFFNFTNDKLNGVKFDCDELKSTIADVANQAPEYKLYLNDISNWINEELTSCI